jgi:hypothetical protein
MKPRIICLIIDLLANATPTYANGPFVEVGRHGPNYGEIFATIQAGRKF